MKMIRMALAVMAAALVTACASNPSDGGTTPAQAVYQMESNFTAALQIAVAYKNLPACGPTAPPLCSKPETVAKVVQASNSTQAALQAAQNTVRNPGAGANPQTAIFAAQQALQALTAITATLQVKP